MWGGSRCVKTFARLKSVRRGYLPGSHVVSSLHLFIHLPLANAESRAKIRHRNKHSWHLPATTTWKFPRSSAADVYGDPRWAPHQQQHTFQLVSPWARSIPLSLPHAILPLLLVFLFNSHLFFLFLAPGTFQVSAVDPIFFLFFPLPHLQRSTFFLFFKTTCFTGSLSVFF